MRPTGANETFINARIDRISSATIHKGQQVEDSLVKRCMKRIWHGGFNPMQEK